MKLSLLFIKVLLIFPFRRKDIRFNNPLFQGIKNNVIWRAMEATAIRASHGFLIIKALEGSKRVPFKISSTGRGTYSSGTYDSEPIIYVATNANGKLNFATILGQEIVKF
jgi:hypothetical protein